jgi:hypothetical protein
MCDQFLKMANLCTYLISTIDAADMYEAYIFMTYVSSKYILGLNFLFSIRFLAKNVYVKALMAKAFMHLDLSYFVEKQIYILHN